MKIRLFNIYISVSKVDRQTELYNAYETLYDRIDKHKKLKRNEKQKLLVLVNKLYTRGKGY